jgi:hypothetical protein
MILCTFNLAFTINAQLYATRRINQKALKAPEQANERYEPRVERVKAGNFLSTRGSLLVCPPCSGFVNLRLHLNEKYPS